MNNETKAREILEYTYGYLVGGAFYKFKKSKLYKQMLVELILTLNTN